MRTAQEIYEEFNVMPNLQLHQLRVAAVAKIVSDNIGGVHTNEILLACLFHDMGNIIKSDLERFPGFVAPKGQPYWEEIKASFVRKYGGDTHVANVTIAKEIGLPDAVVQNIDTIGFSNMQRIAEATTLEPKIFEYADTRVGPHGILPVRERLEEARARYLAAQSKKEYYKTEDSFEKLSQAAMQIERQIFEKATIKPEDITDEAVAPLIDELRNYPVD